MKQNIVFGIIRAVLASLGGVVGGAGYANESDWAQVSGAIMVLVAAIWSIIEKRKISLPPAAGVMVAFVLISGLLLCGGCSTTANDVAMARIAADTASNYYSQPNSATYMEFEGSNVTFSVTGASKLVFSGPIPTKSIYPREEGALKTVIEGVTDVAKTAAMGIVGVQAFKAVKAQKPTVVTTEKLVPVEGAIP
jgi:hypothetical protein